MTDRTDVIKSINKIKGLEGILGTPEDAEFFSTGIATLDEAAGGGVAQGRILELYGPESSGKTALTSHIISQFQKAGLLCGFVDSEHALNPSYAEVHGVNMDELIVAQPDSMEQALNLTEALVVRGVDLVVVDSVSAMVPKAELDGDVGDHMVGVHARLMSQALRKLSGRVKKHNATVIFINQIRLKIGVLFGSPETTSGGQALKFFASQRFDIRKIKTYTDKDKPVGIRCRVRLVKNKVAVPYKSAEFDMWYASGFDVTGSAGVVAVERGIIRKSGSYYYYPPEAEKHIAQGEQKLSTYLQENPDVFAEIMGKLNA